jgi:hypothetical protein
MATVLSPYRSWRVIASERIAATKEFRLQNAARLTALMNLQSERSAELITRSRKVLKKSNAIIEKTREIRKVA